MAGPDDMGEPRPPRLILGDCLSVMRGMDSASVDAVCCDPPSSIGFMNKSWDHHRGGRTQWVAWLAERMAEAARVIRPGHYALVWALPRTSHWTACALEDAGWTLIERIAHVFGTGFPKSKARLKPAVEDWWLCRAPGGGKVRELGIDACRVAHDPKSAEWVEKWSGDAGHPRGDFGTIGTVFGGTPAGRWPSNICLTHSAACRPAGTRKVRATRSDRPDVPERRGNRSDYRIATGTANYASPDGTETIEAWLCSDNCPVRQLDEQAGERRSGSAVKGDEPSRAGYSGGWGRVPGQVYGDTGGASRFFPTFAWSDADSFPLRYHPKASKSDRGEGNTHPTVKPLALTRWLVRLGTPPGGVVLDPFMGSGTTGLACMAEGFGFVGIESDPDYHRIASRRLAEAAASTPLFAVAGPSAAP